MAIESKKSLVLFLDILGYRHWVEKNISYEGIYQIFDELYFKHERFGDMAENENFTRGFKQQLNLYIVSDSIVLLLNLEDDKNKITYMSIFLQYVSRFIIEFISKTGFLLRGGFTCGDFVLKDIRGKKDNIFIFSKAYNRAVELEEETEFPRIIVDNSFVHEFDQIYKKESLENGFLKYHWNTCYFDYYYKLEKYFSPNLSKKLLLQTKDIITKVYQRGRKNFNNKVKEKYYYFRDYHNSLIDKMLRAQLLDSDFKKLKLKKSDVLKQLEYLGIVDSNAYFPIKKDIEPNSAKILQRICLGDFGKKHAQLSIIIKQRIEANNKEIKKLKIDFA